MRNTYILSMGVDFTEGNYTTPLSCCENDAVVFADFFKDEFSLPVQNIQKLINQNCTVSGFQDAISNYAKKMEKEDVIIIYYSGHGGQVTDYDLDEAEDRKKRRLMRDETYCFYNRMITDDEIHNSLLEFKEGVKILMFIDSCHSGDSYRNAIKETSTKVYKFCNNKSQEIKLEQVYKKIKKNPEKLKADLFFISACNSEELAQAGDTNSLFTEELIKILKKSKEESLNKIADSCKKNSRLNKNDMHPENPTSQFGKDILIDLVQAGRSNATGGFLLNGVNLNFSNADLLRKANKVIKESLSSGEKLKKVDEDTLCIYFKEAKLFSKDDLKKYLKGLEKQFKTEGCEIESIEPDITIENPKSYTKSAEVADPNVFLNSWPKPEDDIFDWYKKGNFTQLEDALKKVKNSISEVGQKIKIGIIDTGVWPSHPASPQHLNMEESKSFIDGEEGNDATAKNSRGNRSMHGVATAAILAGKEVSAIHGRYDSKKGSVGAIPFAEILPLRAVEDVVLLNGNSNAVANAIIYAVDKRCQVISISLGGMPNKRLAKAVNYAYEKGVVIVAAAGNNFNTLTDIVVPEEVVYPSRYQRVITACGVCANHLPYDFKAQKQKSFNNGEQMQGNSGPTEAMKDAVAAYTPNVPWATIDFGANGKVSGMGFSRRGGGTSSATPQIAAAAALYLVYYQDELKKKKYVGSWKQAESVRRALFESADSSTYPQSKKYYGNGILQSLNALSAFREVEPSEIAPEAKYSWNVFETIDLYF